VTSSQQTDEEEEEEEDEGGEGVVEVAATPSSFSPSFPRDPAAAATALYDTASGGGRNRLATGALSLSVTGGVEEEETEEEEEDGVVVCLIDVAR
jgi:hypothetical protein